jgi:peptidoglycan hydrolase CwlO-like protein
MFWKKNNNGQDTGKNVMDTDSYAKLLNRIVERDADISTLKSKVANLQLDVDNLRNKMSKKLRDLQTEFDETESEKDLSDGYVPFG